MKDILSVITAYREERGWTEYQLAERSGLPQSTISSWYHKNMVPTIPSLEKICTAFDITLSQLFAEEDAPVSLTEAQKKLLERWSRLSEEQQAVVFALIANLLINFSKNNQNKKYIKVTCSNIFISCAS